MTGRGTDPPPPAAPPPAAPPAEPRQRWRIVFRRRPEAPRLAQREQLAAWELALASSGLPLAGLDLPASRPRLVFAAPLAVGMPAERELVDFLLVDRQAIGEVRERVSRSLPAGHDLVDVHDVWLGEPSLSGQVIAADYRLVLGDPPDDHLDRAALVEACARLLGSRALPRTREKGARTIAYDLRPLVGDVAVLEGPGPQANLRIRTRFDPERGVGRPEEVVATLGELVGRVLEIREIVREQLLLARDG